MTDTIAIAASLPTGLIDRIINGGMLVCPEGTQTVADTGVAFGVYRVLTQSGSVQTSQLTNPEDNGVQARALRITQTQATAQRVGLAQTITNADCQDLRSSPLNAFHRARFSQDERTMFAVLEWDGTADSVPADPINDWTSTSYIPGQFFISSVTVLNFGYLRTAQEDVWGTAPYIPYQANAGLNNLIYVVWTENTVTQNGTFDIGLVQLAKGAQPQQFEYRPEGIDELLIGEVETEIVITPPEITANQNNYNPAGWETATIVRLSSDAAYWTITGFEAATIANDRKTICNIGEYNLLLAGESTSSDADNRMSVGGVGYLLSPGQTVAFLYDATSQRWRLEGQSPNCLNVRDFWQVGDADDSASFQRAFDQAFLNRGGVVWAPIKPGGYLVNTEVVVTGEWPTGDRLSGGILLIGEMGTDRNSIFGGRPVNSIRKTSGSGGLFRYVSIDDSTIENLCLVNETATTNYLVKIMAANTPNITGTNFGFRHVDFRMLNIATTDAQVVLSSFKLPWFEDCYWTDGQSDAVRIGDNAADSPSTLVTGKVFDAVFTRCRFQGDIQMRQVEGLTFNSCEFWEKRTDPDTTAAVIIYPDGDELTDSVVFNNCTANNSGDDTRDFFTQGTNGRNVTVIGGIYGDYANGFVLNGSGKAAFLGAQFTVMADSDIQINGVGVVLLDHSDHGGAPANGSVDDNRTNFATGNSGSYADIFTAAVFSVASALTPSQITSNQNNYAPTGNRSASVWRLSTDTVRNITGIVPYQNGQLLILHNIGSFSFNLINQSASSDEENRFLLFSDIQVRPACTAMLRYDNSTDRWRLVSFVGPGTVIDEFASSGTWTNRPGAVRVYVEAIGPGAGGGGGGKANAGSAVSGGGGGGGGGAVATWFNAASLSASETVTVGTGGAGGTGATVNGPGSDGSIGSAATTFGSLVSGFRGGFGAGGDIATASGGGAGASQRANGGNAAGATPGSNTSSIMGGAGGSSGDGSNATSYSGGAGGGGCSNAGVAGLGGLGNLGPGGGGSGGGVSAANAFQAGGDARRANTTSGVAGGTSEGQAGTAGSATNGSLYGPGGGGGAGSNAGTGGAGGAGGIYGAGGGGGGGAHTGNGGAGGAGANGYCRVTTFF